MIIQVGDFVLIEGLLYGVSDKADFGPWIVQVDMLNLDIVTFTHYTSVSRSGSSSGKGSCTYDQVIAKIHERDVKALFKKVTKGKTHD